MFVFRFKFERIAIHAIALMLFSPFQVPVLDPISPRGRVGNNKQSLTPGPLTMESTPEPADTGAPPDRHKRDSIDSTPSIDRPRLDCPARREDRRGFRHLIVELAS